MLTNVVTRLTTATTSLDVAGRRGGRGVPVTVVSTLNAKTFFFFSMGYYLSVR